MLVQRNIPIRLEASDFSYVPKNDKKILDDRMEQIALALAGPSEASADLQKVVAGNAPFPAVEALANQINALSDTFGSESPLCARFAAHLTQGLFESRSGALDRLGLTLDQYRELIQKEKTRISGEEDEAQNRALLEKKESQKVLALLFMTLVNCYRDLNKASNLLSF